MRNAEFDRNQSALILIYTFILLYLALFSYIYHITNHRLLMKYHLVIVFCFTIYLINN